MAHLGLYILGVYSCGFEVQSLGFGFRVRVLEVCGLEFAAWGLGVGVSSLGIWVEG